MTDRFPVDGVGLMIGLGGNIVLGSSRVRSTTSGKVEAMGGVVSSDEVLETSLTSIINAL